MDNTAYCTLVKKYKRKDGKYNIKLCIYFNGDRHYFQTEFDLTEEEWTKLKSPNLKEKKLIEIRDSLSEIENTARKVLKKTDYHNFDSFEESYFNEIHKVKKDSDFLCWFDEECWYASQGMAIRKKIRLKKNQLRKEPWGDGFQPMNRN